MGLIVYVFLRKEMYQGILLINPIHFLTLRQDVAEVVEAPCRRRCRRVSDVKVCSPQQVN